MTAELFEPTPSKRLIVPEGSTAFWGVDFSTKAVSVGSAHPGPENRVYRAVKTIRWPEQESPARLAWAYDIVSRTLADFVRAGALPAPGLVGVEKPGGKNVSEHLVHMEGILQAAVHAALVAAKVPVCRQARPVPGHWKLMACGAGNIYKPKKGETHEYGVLTWAKSRGYTGTSWDEADALGIAESLRREYLLEPH